MYTASTGIQMPLYDLTYSKRIPKTIKDTNRAQLSDY